MRNTWPGILLLLGCFCLLCTLLAAVGTAFDAWREHIHAGWPAAQARISDCEIREYQGQGKSYYIRCHYAYVVADRAIAAQIDSATVPDPARVIWRSPGYPDLGDLQAWVDAHPAGTPVELHYDPARPQAAVLVVTDMPRAGPRAMGDLRVVRLFAALSLALLLLGSLWRKLAGGNGSPAAQSKP